MRNAATIAAVRTVPSGSWTSRRYDLVSPPWTDSKDVDPVWLGDTVYFISDRDGIANVWSYETATQGADAADASSWTSTSSRSMPAAVAWCSSRAAASTTLDPKTGKATQLAISAAGDFPWMMPRLGGRDDRG